MSHKTPADPVSDIPDGRQQQRHDERAGDRQVEKLFQEIGREPGQPARSPVGSGDIVPVEQEQVQLFTAHQMIGIDELEETERPQKGRRSSQMSGFRFASLFYHLANMRFFIRISKERGGRLRPPPPL